MCVANLEELQKEFESLKTERDELTASLSEAALRITQGSLPRGVADSEAIKFIFLFTGGDDDFDEDNSSSSRFGSFSHQETIMPGKTV